MKADIHKLLSPRKRKWKADEAGALLLMIFAQHDARWNHEKNGDPFAFPIEREITPEEMRRATECIEAEMEAYYNHGEATGIYTEEELYKYRLYKDLREFLVIAIRQKDTEERVITTAIDGMTAVGVLSASVLIQEKELEKRLNKEAQMNLDDGEKIKYIENIKKIAISREKNLIEAVEEAYRYLVVFDRAMDLIAEVSGIKELGLIKSGKNALRKSLEELNTVILDIVSGEKLPLPILELEMLSTKPSEELLRPFLRLKKSANIYNLSEVSRTLSHKIKLFSKLYYWKGGDCDKTI